MAVSTLQVVGLVVLGVGLVLHIVGTATPGWMTYPLSTGTFERGLFKECMYPGRCVKIDLDEAKSAHEAVVHLCLIGMALSVIACGLGFVSVYWTARLPDLYNSPALASMLLCFISGTAIIVAIIVYGVEIYKGENKDYYDLDYAFGLCTTGAPFIIAGGVLIWQGRKRKILPEDQIQKGLVLQVSQQPDSVYQPQAEGTVHQQGAGAMVREPEAEGMVNQQGAREIILFYPPQAGALESRPQAEGPECQLQDGAVELQTLAEVYQEERDQELIFFDGSSEDRLKAENKV